MSSKTRVRDPKPLMMAGMAFLAVALLWPRFVPITGALGPDAIDGTRGFLIGLSIALNLWAARLGGRLRRGNGR
jgi:hypothetical protein